MSKKPSKKSTPQSTKKDTTEETLHSNMLEQLGLSASEAALLMPDLKNKVSGKQSS